MILEREGGERDSERWVCSLKISELFKTNFVSASPVRREMRREKSGANILAENFGSSLKYVVLCGRIYPWVFCEMTMLAQSTIRVSRQLHKGIVLRKLTVSEVATLAVAPFKPTLTGDDDFKGKKGERPEKANCFIIVIIFLISCRNQQRIMRKI